MFLDLAVKGIRLKPTHCNCWGHSRQPWRYSKQRYTKNKRSPILWSSYGVGCEEVNQPHILVKNTADCWGNRGSVDVSTQKRKQLVSAIEKFAFATKEALPVPPEPEAASLAPTPAATLITEKPPTPFAALSALTAPGPFASAAEIVPAPSKESSLIHRLQAHDSRGDSQVYGGCVRRENTANFRCWQPRWGARK